MAKPKIKQILEEFLKDQKARLKLRTYRDYDEVISLFEQCLNSYAHESLDKKDAELFKRLFDKGKEFCEIFGPDKIGEPEIAEFLDYFMIRKVICTKEFLKAAGWVMKRFVKWMREKGYMGGERYEAAATTVDELKDELPEASELADLIFDYIRGQAPAEITDVIEGYFTVTRIEPGRLWLEDYDGPSGVEIGPISVSRRISSKCRTGWVISLELGKTRKGWRMLGVGNVYSGWP